jgi:hypothetical protein
MLRAASAGDAVTGSITGRAAQQQQQQRTV